LEYSVDAGKSDPNVIDSFLDQRHVARDPIYRRLIEDRAGVLGSKAMSDLNGRREYWEIERDKWQNLDEYSVMRRRDAEAWLEAIGYVVAHPDLERRSPYSLKTPAALPHPNTVSRAKSITGPAIQGVAGPASPLGSDKSPDLTVESFSKDYLVYVQTNFANKTYENAERVLLKFDEMFGNRSVTSLTLEDLEKYKSARKAEGVSATTINIDTKTMKAAFAVAADWGRTKSNPFAKVKPIKTNKYQAAYLTAEDFVKLIQSINRPWLLDVIRVGVLTGMRLGEIMNLKWSDYDAAKKEITIVSSDSYRVKGGKMRTIPLVTDASAILDAKKRSSEWIFVNEKGRKCTDDYVSKLLKAYVRKSGLSDEIHFHSLRHTYCTWAAEANMPIHVLKALAGHSTVRVTEQYIGTDKQFLRAEAEKVKLPVAPNRESAEGDQEKP
jgi:integrase